ncbi:hypothetical protein [Neobacillus massiliamazoniensis]|jgi:hypothetical protein|uniref:Uncharacterized protein n=1 Tax=Neobacillus massiliamazoniensis TaxID=1499688 RepID=A0A0U1NYS5_9BACI|nr:hypothetical protein [Neobacillus massiliamazoniensis]CRK83153.1 hypothetical protein BN000_03112 [Neobacillus massiliamazoniensis]
MENQFSNFINDLSLQTKMENVWQNTCGSWENCNETTIQSFLAQCLEYNLDPQFCMSWVEKHQSEIPNWTAVSKTSLDWVNKHTSTGTAISINDQEI